MAVFERDDELVIVVADGAGGLVGAAAASEAVVAAVRDVDAAAWPGRLRELDAALAGETTAVIVSIGAASVSGLSAGDSEAWLLSARGIDRLTAAPSRARIGSGRARPVPFHRHGLDGGILLVATDGLFHYAAADAIAACCVGPANEIADRLIALPRLRSGAYPDDVALAVAVDHPKSRA